MLKEENMTRKEKYMLKVVDDIKLKLSRKEKRIRSSRRHKTKVIKEKEIEVYIKLSRNEKSRKRDKRKHKIVEERKTNGI